MTYEWPRVYAERNYFSLWEIMFYGVSTWQWKVLVRKWIVTDNILTGWGKVFTIHCMNSAPHLQLIKVLYKHRLQVHSFVTYMTHTVSQYTFALPSWLVNYHCKGEKKKHPFTHHVLLGNEAFNKAIRMGLLKDIREGWVLGVTIHGHHTSAGIPHLLQGYTISLPGGHLSGQTNSRSFIDPSFEELQKNLQKENNHLKTMSVHNLISDLVFWSFEQVDGGEVS